MLMAPLPLVFRYLPPSFVLKGALCVNYKQEPQHGRGKLHVFMIRKDIPAKIKLEDSGRILPFTNPSLRKI